MKNRRNSKLLALLLAFMLMISVSTVFVCADTDEGTTAETDSTDVTTDEETEDAATSADESAEETEDETDEVTTDAESTDDEDEEEEESTSFLSSFLSFLGSSGGITLIVIIVIAVIYLIWWAKHREKASKTWRAFKSEFKKVVWADKYETLKNTIVVIIVILAFALVLGIVDYLLSLLIDALALLG